MILPNPRCFPLALGCLPGYHERYQEVENNAELLNARTFCQSSAKRLKSPTMINYSQDHYVEMQLVDPSNVSFRIWTSKKVNTTSVVVRLQRNTLESK